MTESPQPQYGLREEEHAQIRILQGTKFDVVGPILAQSPVRLLAPGSTLISPGDDDQSAYFLLAGRLRVHLQTLDEEPITVIPPGEVVGELATLNETPRSAFVVAQTECRLLEVNKSDFWALLEASHQFSLNLLMTMTRRIRGNNSLILESRELQKKYKRHATVDNLTGLYNRRWFDGMFQRVASRCEREHKPLCVLMLDVDHFKRFNDTYGHQAGDFVLFVLGIVLKARFRPTDLIARYGGEEFVVLMPNTNKENAKTAAERVRIAIAETALEMPDGTQLPSITISMGIGEYSYGEDIKALLGRADEALYRAKAAGRNRTSL